mmetsp:Transcript_49394/g.91488  ORF Transcript_49394/g.91488 Transcript_49394/m.91488 type:complete len:80 (+) Transcript_49394:986-1225(+)
MYLGTADEYCLLSKITSRSFLCSSLGVAVKNMMPWKLMSHHFSTRIFAINATFVATPDIMKLVDLIYKRHVEFSECDVL